MPSMLAVNQHSSETAQMATSKVLMPEAFAVAFREAIRVGFNWDRFFEESWPIELVTLNSPSGLARCFIPWYVGKMGDELAYDDLGAVPMSLTDVPKVMGILNDERQVDIQKYADSFSRQAEVVEFAARTYALPDNPRSPLKIGR